MKKIFSVLTILISLASFGQVPTYNPPDPETLRLPVLINGVVNQVTVGNLTKTKVSLTKHTTDSSLLRGLINGKLNTSDTAAMLAAYKAGMIANTAGLTGKLNTSDTSAMLTNYRTGIITNTSAIASAIFPTISGGIGATSTLTFKATSGVGITGSDIIFTGGNNGGTEYARFLTNGKFGIGTNNPPNIFSISADDVALITAKTNTSSVGYQFNNSSGQLGSLFVSGSAASSNPSLVGIYTSATNGFSILKSDGVRAFTMFQSGDFSIGNTTDGGFRLDVTGPIRASGQASLGATTVGGNLVVTGNLNMDNYTTYVGGGIRTYSGGVLQLIAGSSGLNINNNANVSALMTMSNTGVTTFSNDVITASLLGTQSANGVLRIKATNNATTTTAITTINENGGNVGVNTSAPLAAFHIGSSQVDMTFGAGAGPNLASNLYYSGGWKYIKSSQAASAIAFNAAGVSLGDIGFYTAPSGTANGSATLSARMMILEGGNVGIGTTSPGALLDIVSANTNNQFRIYSNNNGTPVGERTYSTSDGSGLILNSYYSLGALPYTRYNDFVGSVSDGATAIMRFLTKGLNASPAVRLLIDANGSSSFTPSLSASSGATATQSLTISGTINNTGSYSGTHTSLLVNPTATSLTGTTLKLLDLQVGGSSKFMVDNNGTVHLVTTSAPASPNNGDIWFDGTDLKIRVSGTTYTITKQ